MVISLGNLDISPTLKPYNHHSFKSGVGLNKENLQKYEEKGSNKGNVSIKIRYVLGMYLENLYFSLETTKSKLFLLHF